MYLYDGKYIVYPCNGVSLSQKEKESYQMAQWQRILLTMQEIGIPSLGWEDLLEKEMATHASIFCLGNPLDRGAWRATVHRAAKSQTRLSD